MKDEPNRFVRHVGFPVRFANRFKIRATPPSEQWSANVQIEWTWRGRGHWHCFFFPWWPDKKS